MPPTVIPGGDAGEMAGIDPQQLGDLIRSISSRTSQAQTLVNGWIAELNRVGLDTSQMTRAAQDLAWAQDQLPMLKRRQELIIAAGEQGGSPALTAAAAGNLTFTTSAAAAKAGAAAGAKARQALQDSQNVDFIAFDLAENAGDPSYLAAFFQALGPQELTRLGMYINTLPAAQQRAWSQIAGHALATASFQLPLNAKWLSQADASALGHGPDLHDLAPFLGTGVYSSGWLSTLGAYALGQAKNLADRAQQPSPGMDVIWTALAHNPAAAAQFYHDNFSQISDDMTNPLLYHFVDDSAFAGFVSAATIAPKGADPKPFAANAERTVKYFGKDSGLRTSDPVRQAMGTIAMNYFGDLSGSVRAAAPFVGLKDVPGWQVCATSPEWGNFVEEAMRDKTAAAQLLTFYSVWKNAPAQSPDWRGRGQENVPEQQGFWNHFSIGMLDDFMASHYQAAGATAGGDNNHIAEAAASGGAAFLASLAFGPEAGVAGVVAALEEGGQDAFKTNVEQDLTQAFNGGDPEKPSDPYGLIQQLTGMPNAWSSTVIKWYNDGNGSPPIDPVVYRGQPYNGDPGRYINEYGGSKVASFIQDGQIKDPATMTAPQLAAYNAWLQDPAIVNANQGAFKTDDLGRLSASYARSFALGGGG